MIYEFAMVTFRLLVNRSATWADWDDELLAAELRDLQASEFDLGLTGFDPGEVDEFLVNDSPSDDEAPPLPVHPVTCAGDLWICGPHRVLCGDSTDSDAVSRLLGAHQPLLLVTDPPYGIELDSEWRDRAGLNTCGAAQPSYLKRRTKGHRETTISGDTRADWSEAFALVPSLEVGYVWHASKFTREVLDGLLRIGFLHHQQIEDGYRQTFLAALENCANGRKPGYRKPCVEVVLLRRTVPWFPITVAKSPPHHQTPRGAGRGELRTQPGSGRLTTASCIGSTVELCPRKPHSGDLGERFSHRELPAPRILIGRLLAHNASRCPRQCCQAFWADL